MKAKSAKKLYNHLPEWIKIISGSLIRKKLINNKIFKAQYNELVKVEKFSKERTNEIQFELLKNTCIYAYEYTEYYKELFDIINFNPYELKDVDEFSNKVPTIDKEEVIANFDKINVKDIKDFYPSTTGGSSGTRLQINNSWETFYKENAFHYHYMSKFGYDYKKHKLLLLAGEESEELCSCSPLHNMIRVSGRHLNQENFHLATNYINKFKPDFIIALPSAMYQFCKYLKITNEIIKCNIQYIFFRSENINPVQRKFIETTMGCKTTAYYGSTERVAWGEEYENKDGVPVYSFHPMYGVVEIDKEDGISLVSTGFINSKMPLLRYKTDDIIVEVETNKYTVEGHRMAVMVGKKGESISVEYFCHLEEIFDIVEKYQFEQYVKGEAIVKIVPRRPLSAEEILEVEKKFEKMAAERIKFKVDIVEHVKLTPRGKFKLLYHSIDM